LIRLSDNVVFFGGEGVSTESGISNYRSKSGIFEARQVYAYPPDRLLSHTMFKQHPAQFFKHYKENLVTLTAKPNAAHYALAKLESAGKLHAIITQNVDGLHKSAGSKNVLELHGSNLHHYCGDCGAEFTLDYIFNERHCRDNIPYCAKCEGIVRPSITLYEELLDDDLLSEASRIILNADTLIVGGTSLLVHPSASLISFFQGKNFIILNKSPTIHDFSAKLIIRSQISEILVNVLEMLNIN
jgi:NAD-dependent deacetylase